MVTAQLMAPIAPFFSEWLYKTLPITFASGPGSLTHPAIRVHSPHVVDQGIGNAQRRRAWRSRWTMRSVFVRLFTRCVKQQGEGAYPITKILLPVLDEKFAQRVKSVENMIKAEVNVKEIQYINDASGLLVKR